MQVNISNNSLTFNRFSGANYFSGICLPNFNGAFMYSQKNSDISDSKYQTKIIEQAYEDCENGTFQKSSGFNNLMKEYVSVVSPDRCGIIASGLKAISKNNQSESQAIDIVSTFLEGEVRYQNLPSNQASSIDFYDSNGEMVATYSGNTGWVMSTTSAENARMLEMRSIYNNAWGNAQKGIPLESNEATSTEPLPSSFDAQA